MKSSINTEKKQLFPNSFYFQYYSYQHNPDTKIRKKKQIESYRLISLMNIDTIKFSKISACEMK